MIMQGGGQAKPLLNLDLRLGGGTGALMAVPLTKAGCAIMSEVANFQEVLDAAQ